MYYALINEQGNRVTSYVLGVNCCTPPDGTIEITDEQQQQLCNGTHIWDWATMATIEKPPYVPAADDQIAAIEARYEAKFSILRDRISTVMLADGTTQDTKVAVIQQEYAALCDLKNSEIMEILLGGVE